MTGRVKTLYLLRHAKSAWDTNAPDDFSRPLSSRGSRDIQMIGRWMKKKNLFPERIVSSPALRAWQTAISLSHELEIDPATIDFDKHIYLAGVSELSRAIVATKYDVESLLLVGHNPGLELLLEYLLTDEPPEYPDGKLLPTATLCVLQISSWDCLDNKPAQLSLIRRPRKTG